MAKINARHARLDNIRACRTLKSGQNRWVGWAGSRCWCCFLFGQANTYSCQTSWGWTAGRASGEHGRLCKVMSAHRGSGCRGRCKRLDRHGAMKACSRPVVRHSSELDQEERWSGAGGTTIDQRSADGAAIAPLHWSPEAATGAGHRSGAGVATSSHPDAIAEHAGRLQEEWPHSGSRASQPAAALQLAVPPHSSMASMAATSAGGGSSAWSSAAVPARRLLLRGRSAAAASALPWALRRAATSWMPSRICARGGGADRRLQAR